MKVSLNWLGDHLDLNGRSTDELSDLLTFAGIEVEGIEERGGDLDNVVVAEIKSADKHPDADRLKVCQVDHGEAELRQIVCGAQNYQVGDKVPLALPGAKLPNGMKIKPGKLRGVKSFGMLCSPSELGAPLEIDGLWILPTDSRPGQSVSDFVERDTIFDLEVTPNRPDLLSHLGVARDLAALAETPLKGAAAHYADGKTSGSDTVATAAPEACPLYTVRRISGVTIAPSPDWLAAKLTSIGLRPINNIVDITNYVLMEMGQPLHAFDAAKVKGTLTARPADEGESFQALDGATYTLKTEDLVIADGDGAVALAGVMGGEGSGVTDGTTDIILEAAYFSPSPIRRTSRRLALSSDSSYRFERGVDPAQVLGASELATRLICEIAGGTAADTVEAAGSLPPAPVPVPLAVAQVQQVMGTPIESDEIDRILTALGLRKSGSEWEIPSFRLDLSRPIDLVEEVARVYGLDDIPSSTSGPATLPSDADIAYEFGLRLKEDLAARGFHECTTIKLISESQLNDSLCIIEDAEPVRLKNPLSDDHTVLRNSLLPGLIASAERNVRMGQRSLKLFEAGTVFGSTPTGTSERQHLGFLLAGATVPAGWSDPDPRPANVFDLIGTLHFLASTSTAEFVPGQTANFLIAADIVIGKTTVGKATQLTPAHSRELGFDSPVVATEIDLAALREATSKRVLFAELPKFPSVTRDVALELPIEFPNADVAKFFRNSAEPLLESVELFDLYVDAEGKRLPADRKSVAYTLTYRNLERTLTGDEVDAAHGRILAELKRALPAAIR